MKKKPEYLLTIGWLYPELMSTYGDRGNIFVITLRCKWRNIGVTVVPIGFETGPSEIKKCDFVFGGGAQDRQQSILITDLREKKGPVLKELFDNGRPGLFVCGAPQLLGHYYMTGDGEKLEGLGLFDMVSKHFGKEKPRCIGNLIAEINDDCPLLSVPLKRKTIVGFENHGGRTYLGNGVAPFARVVSGYGNNGEDGSEGAVYKNCIATYSHGPFLPKNPHIADLLIAKALAVKYGKQVVLSPLNDSLAWRAHDFVIENRV